MAGNSHEKNLHKSRGAMSRSSGWPFNLITDESCTPPKKPDRSFNTTLSPINTNFHMRAFLFPVIMILTSCSRPSVDPTLRAKADAGELESQLLVGNLLLDQKDNKLGRKYMQMAAEQGSIDALNNLGYMAQGGTGLPANMREALMYHRIAQIMRGIQSANVPFDKKHLDRADIQSAESDARKWLAERPRISAH